MIKRNQMGVIFNSFQGDYKKVLTVCSAGCLRSPTAAHILSGAPWNFNTRCAGTSEAYAIIPLTDTLIVWADIILVMDSDMVADINSRQIRMGKDSETMFDLAFKPVVNLEIEDDYNYRDPKLVEIMTEKLLQIFKQDISGELND